MFFERFDERAAWSSLSSSISSSESSRRFVIAGAAAAGANIWIGIV